MDRVYQEELAHDVDSVNPEPYMAEALDDLIWKLFDDKQQIGYPSWGLRDFLMWQEDVVEIAYRLLLGEDLRGELEQRVRKYLENSNTLLDHATELARGE